MKPPHSRLGIASLALALTAGALALAAAAPLSLSGLLERDYGVVVRVGWGLVGCSLLTALAGLGLGVCSFVQKGCNVTFAVFGASLSALVFIGVVVAISLLAWAG